MSTRTWLRGAGATATGLALMLWSAPAALAAAPTKPDAGVPGLDAWAKEVTDSSGVPIDKYQALPLDHGAGPLDINPMRDALVAVLDFFWGLHYTVVTVCMWLLHMVLSFAWVDWFAKPMEQVGANFGQMVSQLHWIPLAAMISGTTIGLLFAARRRGAAWGEMFVSVTMVFVATHIALNPVSYITGPEGVLATSQQTAAQIAVEATGGKSQLDAGADASGAMAKTVMADLTDSMLRGPSQAVAFGSILNGDCAGTFTEKMKAADPMDVKSKSVMDPVKGCSESAKHWSESTSFTKVAPMLMVNLGSGAFGVLVAVMTIVLFLAVLAALFYGVYQALAAMISILPGSSRKEFFGAFVGVIACGVVIVAVIALVAVFVRLIATMLTTTAPLGVTLQMLLLDLMLIALLVLVLRVRNAIMSKSDKTARWLSRLGAGQEKKATARVKTLASMAGSGLGGYKLAQRNRPAGTHTAWYPTPSWPDGPAGAPAAGGPAAGGPDGGGAGPTRPLRPSRGPSTPGPRTGGGAGGAGRRPRGKGPALPPAPVVRAIGAGASVVGGPAGMAVNAVAQSAAWSIERQKRRELTGPGQPPRVPRASRIVVGPDGKAQIRRREGEVLEGTVVERHQGPQPPAPRRTPASTPASRELRDRLRRDREGRWS